MPTDSMIQAEGLKKRYGETIALAGIDLDVPAGAILGMLGPNGAGKTTAVRILTTLALPRRRSGACRRLRRRRRGAPGAAQHRGHRPGRHSRRDADRPPEPRHDRAPERAAPGRGTGEGAPSCSSSSSSSDAGDRVLKGYSGRNAQAPRPGGGPGDPPAGAVPRRADDRARPDEPGAHVGHHPRARGRRRHPSPHHPVPRRGRRARRPDRRRRPRPRHRRRHRPRAEDEDRRGTPRGDPARSRPGRGRGPRAALSTGRSR